MVIIDYYHSIPCCQCFLVCNFSTLHLYQILLTICYSFLSGAFRFPFCIVNENIAKLWSQTEQFFFFGTQENCLVNRMSNHSMMMTENETIDFYRIWTLLGKRMEDGNQWIDIKLYLQKAPSITFLYLLHFPVTFYHWMWTYA